MTPGLKFSTKMSARSASRSAVRSPSGDFRSSSIDFLLALFR